MAINKIDHICIAVRSIDDAADFFENNFGLEIGDKQEIPQQGVRLAFFDIAGVKIELIEPLDDTSHIKKYLDKKGPGLHHIALEVEDLAQSLAILKGHDVRLIGDEPKTGAHGKKIAFIHPANVTGALIEICE